MMGSGSRSAHPGNYRVREHARMRLGSGGQEAPF